MNTDSGGLFSSNEQLFHIARLRELWLLRDAKDCPEDHWPQEDPGFGI